MILFIQSQAIQEAAYECQWYQHSKMIIMARSQHAVQLTAYQFYVICLETFAKVQYPTGRSKVSVHLMITIQKVTSNVQSVSSRPPGSGGH
jgi:hypothetical protein